MMEIIDAHDLMIALQKALKRIYGTDVDMHTRRLKSISYGNGCAVLRFDDDGLKPVSIHEATIMRDAIHIVYRQGTGAYQIRCYTLQ